MDRQAIPLVLTAAWKEGTLKSVLSLFLPDLKDRMVEGQLSKLKLGLPHTEEPIVKFLSLGYHILLYFPLVLCVVMYPLPACL